MIVFKLIFVGLVAYGIWIGLYGGAILAFLMLGVAYLGEAIMRRQDRKFRESPKSASTVPDTLELLDRKGCACNDPNFPSQISKSDS